MNTMKEIEEDFDTKFDFDEIFDEERIYNLKRLVILVGGSLVITFVGIYLWLKYRWFLYTFFGLDDTSQAAELGSDLAVFMPAILYGVAQGFVIDMINKQNARLESAIDTLNAVMFLEERDRRVSPLLHWMLGFASIPTIGMICLYDYCSVPIGIFAIGTCLFLASFAFFVALELDNPFNGYSRVCPKRIPHGWETMTIYDILDGKVLDFQMLKEKREKDIKEATGKAPVYEPDEKIMD